jgi:hypothetical protein
MRLAQDLLAAFSLLVEAVFCLRGLRLKLCGKFPMLYSYVAYILLTSVVGLVLFAAHSPYYSSVFWLIFISYMMAEFAIVGEISDHLFFPYPSIRYLGRALVIFGSALSFLFVLGVLGQPHRMDEAILEFAQRMLIAKFLVILLMLLPTVYYHIGVTSVVKRVIGGFTFFISIGVCNFGVRETLGMAFSPIFSIIGQASFIAMLLIWTRALWNPGLEQLGPPPLSLDPGRRSDWALVQFDKQLKKLLKR